MDHFINSEGEHDINIELKDFTDDESHPYANNQDVTSYDTLHGKNIDDKGLDERVYDDAVDDVYENTTNLKIDPKTRLNKPSRERVQNVYTSFEPRLAESDPTYDTLDRQGKERESEIYHTIAREDETLRPESVVLYKNLKYARIQRGSCVRRRWKLLLFFAIVLLVSISGVIAAVVLVTNEEEPAVIFETTTTGITIDTTEMSGNGSFAVDYDTIESKGNDSLADGLNAKLEPFYD